MPSRFHYLLPTDVEGAEPLVELALNLRWSWNHSTDEIWGQLDPELWELTHNPWIVLQTVSHVRLQERLANPEFRAKLDDLVATQKAYLGAETWFGRRHAGSPLSCVAYFSMEFMLSEGLPIYSGGLGNVAGDQLKAASDLGVPVVGVGLLYQQGYARQMIDATGAQIALFPYNEPAQLPVMPARDRNGEWVRLKIVLPGYSVWLRAWEVLVGRAKLYLLDSNDPANIPTHRGITSELYGGGAELRLMQEMMLGIAGWRLLDELGLRPEVCHLNEGHAAFVVLERARTFMKEAGVSFAAALSATRAGNLFTTHTAISAGFDRFAPGLVAQYLGWYAEQQLGIEVDELLALGRSNPFDSGERFNMASLAIRGSGAVNGVSRLHGAVSRRLLQPLFPHWPEAEVPVGHVTNGVHVPTWDSPEADATWTAAFGKDRWRGTMGEEADAIRRVPDAELWEIRTTGRRRLVRYARARLARQLAVSGAPRRVLVQGAHVFDPDALTLGFARRFTGYKRPNLLLHDPERLLRLLSDPTRPVQLIIAGKAHPADTQGCEMIQQWTRFIARPEAQEHVIFLGDHDLLLTKQLAEGVDLWINTPRRPWEACGTSGMKILANGGLNLSELDGWWSEAFAPEVGWALGDGHEHGDDPAWDAAEADALYTILEREVVPTFYDRDERGVPGRWLALVRESMARLTPRFSADRSVREYTERLYLPAAEACAKRAAGSGALGVELLEWRRELQRAWGAIRFGQVFVDETAGGRTVRVQVYLDDLGPDAVRVELFADGDPPERIAMARGAELVGAANAFTYTASVPGSRPTADYTARVVPYHPHAAVPLEATEIRWAR
jgi:starch phosphorylase